MENFPPSIVSQPLADFPLNEIGRINLDDPLPPGEPAEMPLQVIIRDPNFDQTLEYRIFLDSPPARGRVRHTAGRHRADGLPRASPNLCDILRRAGTWRMSQDRARRGGAVRQQRRAAPPRGSRRHRPGDLVGRGDRRRSSRHRSGVPMRACLVLALFLAAGCSFESPEVQTIENSCANDASCPTGYVMATSASMTRALRWMSRSRCCATRPMRSPETPASWAIGPESFSGSSTRDVVLPATREVRGLVRWDGCARSRNAPFRSPNGWGCRAVAPVPIEVDTLREHRAAMGPRATTSARCLVAGETYDVVVLPSSDMVMTPTGGSLLRFAVFLRSTSSFTIEGGELTSAVPLRCRVSSGARRGLYGERRHRVHLGSPGSQRRR